jgi:gluconolactonase
MLRIAVLVTAGVSLCIGLASAQEHTPYNVDTIAKGFGYVDSVALSSNGALYFTDSPAGRVYEWTQVNGTGLLAKDLKAPAGLAFDERGRLLVCESGARRIIRIGANSVIDVVASAFEGTPLNSPNDVVHRKDGLVFFTDPAFASADEKKSLPFYGVFRLGAKGDVVALAKWPKRPNGIDVSPNGRTLYVAGSDERVVRAYDLDARGTATNERVLISGIDGVPNGLRVDEKGRLYVAAKQLLVYSTEGRLVDRIEVPERPASLVFGDADRKAIYVAARTSVYRLRPEEAK